MREKLRRYGKRVMVFICTLVIFAGSVFSFSFDSLAASNDFVVSYSEPSTSDTQGYVIFLLENLTTGERIVNTWFWSIYAINSSNNVVPAEMLVDATSSIVTFNIYQNGASSIAYCLNNITSAGKYRMKIHTSSQKYVHDYSAEGYKIVSWIAEGNVCVSSLWASETFSVLFSDDADALLLQELLDAVDQFRRQYVVSYGDISLELSQLDANVESILNNTNSMREKINAIYNLELNIQGNVSVIKDYIIQYFPSLSSKIDTLITEQQKSNTWLEKIWNSIQEFLTGEPADDAVPDNSENEDMLGSMQESEEVLLPDTSEAEKSLDVQFNSGFGVLTWLVESFAQMDAGVFSMFLTMLTFGVMALLLGR